jgi:hypothetical protein
MICEAGGPGGRLPSRGRTGRDAANARRLLLSIGLDPAGPPGGEGTRTISRSSSGRWGNVQVSAAGVALRKGVCDGQHRQESQDGMQDNVRCGLRA